MIEVLLVDDQTEIRSALRMLVSAQPDMRVVGEAVDGADAIGLVRRRRPDVVLMDIRMPRVDGLAATEAIVAGPDPPAILVLSTFGGDELVFGALRAGAAGYLLKNAPPDRILDAVRVVASGSGLLAPEVTGGLIRQFVLQSPGRAGDPRLSELSAREHETLLLLARGLSNREIAARLVLEETTVKSHVARVLTKLELASRAQAVVFAYETGLISPGRRAGHTA